MKWALEENLTGTTDMGRVGAPAGSRGSQQAFFARDKDIAALAASPGTLPGRWMCGTCLRMFGFLGNGTLTCVICIDDVAFSDC